MTHPNKQLFDTAEVSPLDHGILFHQRIAPNDSGVSDKEVVFAPGDEDSTPLCMNDMAKPPSPKPTNGDAFPCGPIIGGHSNGRPCYWTRQNGKWEKGRITGEGIPSNAAVICMQDNGAMWIAEKNNDEQAGAPPYLEPKLWTEGKLKAVSELMTDGGGNLVAKKVTTKGLVAAVSAGGAIKILVPIELRDKKNSTEYRVIQKWDDVRENKPSKSSVAWIAAHSDESNPAPRMPQLVLALASATGFKARLEVDYTRGNGGKPHEAQDLVKIPMNGSFKNSADGEIDFAADYSTLPFFGGKATVTYQLIQGGSNVGSEQTIKFAIGGKNPEDKKCRAFIESEPNAGPAGSIWYSYAIAKHEMAEFGGNHYNQFIRRDYTTGAKRNWLPGSPTWYDDSDGPGGYGMFSVTGNSSSDTTIQPRAELWNWQEGARAGLAIIRSKRLITDGWVATQKANAGGSNPLPSLTIGNVTFAEGSNRSMDHVVAIKAYNGRRNVPSGWSDSLPSPTGFFIDNYFNVNYCAWKAQKGWVLNRWKQPKAANVAPINYIALVCAQVED